MAPCRRSSPEFKRDVVAVARRGDLSVPEVAVDFGIAEETVRRWMRQADIDDGIKDGLTTAEQAEIVQLRRAEAPARDGERDPPPGRRLLRQGRAPKMKFPLVRELAAEGFPVRLTCGVLGFSPQAFYKWQADPVCQRDYDDAQLVNAIRDVHEDDPEFGYRFISDELERAGHNVGERRVWRLCSEHRIWSTTTKKGRGIQASDRDQPSTMTSCSGTSLLLLPTGSG